MTLPQMSLAGSLMITAIVLIRALTRGVLPKRAVPVLWWTALLRLTIPFSIPTRRSLFTLTSRLGPAGGERRIAAAVEAGVRFPWEALWAAGALVCAGVFIAAYFRCRRELMTSVPVENDYARAWLRAHRLGRSVVIRQSDRFSSPLTYGILRPVILMPASLDWEDTGALQYVLTHEQAHIRRFDGVMKLALAVALCLHWFNPAVWLMYVLAGRDIELACDESVLGVFGGEARASYARTLISMEEKRSGFAPQVSGFAKNAAEERIVSIMKYKKATIVSVVLAVVLVLSVAAAFAAGPTPEAEGATKVTTLKGNLVDFQAASDGDTGVVKVAYTGSLDDTYAAVDGEKVTIRIGDKDSFTYSVVDAEGGTFSDTSVTYNVWTDGMQELLDSGELKVVDIFSGEDAQD